jgi:hypothetical protein
MYRKTEDQMTETKSPRVRLATEDQERLQRLSEEVRSRIEEMALILARNAGIQLEAGAVRKFVPQRAVAADSPVVEVEIFDLPNGTSGCHVTTADGGGFSEYPCGSGPA